MENENVGCELFCSSDVAHVKTDTAVLLGDV